MSARLSYSLSLVLAGLCFVLCGRSEAADVTVNASFTHKSAEVGESVQLQIEINGSSGRSEPPEVNVEGLDARYMGPSSSQQIQMINGQFTRQITTTYVYQVIPRRAGELIIPALAVKVDGKTYNTQPIALKVEKSSAPNGDDRIVFAEIDIPKRTAYLGEILPVELNFYISDGTRAELEQMPEMTGEGFTKQKMPEPRQQNARKDGRDWKVVSFRTAITPSRAGKITVGPSELSIIAQVPQKRGRRNPRDPFGSLFDDPFFGGGMSERRRLKIEAAAVELDVKPLPVEGRPPDFSGAVGQFKFKAEGSPNRVKIGDPVTMKMTINGSGNFDRMQAPALMDSQGWHPYPASDNFEPGDDLRMTGTKTFEMAVVPETAHKQMPQFRFTFFDPKAGKYVTQTSPPMPLVVEGTPAAVPAPAPAKPATGETEPAPPKPAAATPVPTDILGLRYERGPHATFAPLYTQRGFLLAQLVPLGIAALILGARFLRKDSRAVRLDGLRRERERLWQKLRAEADAAAFYDLAARVVQVDTALATDLDPASVDAAAARRSRPLDPDTSAALDEIFSARAELLYAGGGPARTTLATADRQRVFTMIERFARSHA
jgi:hypothetical protein